MVPLHLFIHTVGFVLGLSIMFENVFNFRDAGGYRTKSGQSVRTGRLFRSGAFSAPTDNDLAQLSSLGLNLVVDLRGPAEQEQSPNRLPDCARPDTVSLPIWPKANNEVERALLAGNIREFADSGGCGEPDTPAAMRNFYRSFVRDHRNEWSRLLDMLCTSEAHPAVLHCAGGKDRTGVAIAIVLTALGVPRDAVMQDYLETNSAVDQWIGADHPNGLPKFFLSVMRADPSYLDAAFSEIEAAFGGFESYLMNHLHVSGRQRELLEAAYLE